MVDTAKLIAALEARAAKMEGEAILSRDGARFRCNRLAQTYRRAAAEVREFGLMAPCLAKRKRADLFNSLGTNQNVT